MDYRDLLIHAPIALRDQLQTDYDHEEHGSIADLLAENRAETSTPTLQLVRACAIFSDAFEIMIDQIIPASREALQLIDQAERQGLSKSVASPYRREIEAVLEEEIQRENEEIADAMAALESGSATADQLASLAYKASDRDQHKLAAEYFLKAAELETEAASHRNPLAKPDSTMNHLVRAGTHFAEAGEFSRAYPFLRQAIEFDWKAGRLWGDRHVVEWAFVAILRQCATLQNWNDFRATWEEAVARSAQLEMSFPSIYPFQEELLTVCIDNRILDLLPNVINAIERRDSRINRDLNSKLELARTLIGR